MPKSVPIRLLFRFCTCVVLDKFYLDVVTPDGAGCIGYAAQVGGLGLNVSPASTLIWDASPESAATQSRSLRGRLPTVEGQRITWDCPALSTSGTWESLQPEIPEVCLWESDSGSVRWHCLAPRARVSLRQGGRTRAGLGYAERLRVDVAPWKIPMKTLHWGRFVSPDHSVIWIRWEHDEPRQWFWHNSRAISEAVLADDGIAWPGHALQFGQRHPLRSGRLGQTVFSKWPQMLRWLPDRLRMIDESKWCTAAILRDSSGLEERGWAIHEIVRFP